MILINRFANEIEPGDIVLFDGKFYPVAQVIKDYQGAVTLGLAIAMKSHEQGDQVVCMDLDTWDDDMLVIALEDA